MIDIEEEIFERKIEYEKDQRKSRCEAFVRA